MTSESVPCLLASFYPLPWYRTERPVDLLTEFGADYVTGAAQSVGIGEIVMSRVLKNSWWMSLVTLAGSQMLLLMTAKKNTDLLPSQTPVYKTSKR